MYRAISKSELIFFFIKNKTNNLKLKIRLKRFFSNHLKEIVSEFLNV